MGAGTAPAVQTTCTSTLRRRRQHVGACLRVPIYSLPAWLPQELTFEVGPTQEPKQLRAALYAVSPGEAPGSDEFIGGGRWVQQGKPAWGLSRTNAARLCRLRRSAGEGGRALQHTEAPRF